MPVFFINSAQILNDVVAITGPLCDHLRGSLRITEGEEFWVCDERRRRYRVRAAEVSRGSLRGHIVEERIGTPRACPPITLAQAIIKGDRMDWVVQKATELGVAAIVPLVTEQGTVRPRPSRSAAQQERWQRIALEAAQQSERWEVPIVSAPRTSEALFSDRSGSDRRLILCERSTGVSVPQVPLPSGLDSGILVAVGPEGGWRREELDLAVQEGCTAVTLGPRILRAETAALAALSIIQSRLGELG